MMRTLRLLTFVFALLAWPISGKTVEPVYEQLKDFGTPSAGSRPYGGLMLGSDGALYGTATQGGSNGFGTVFKINADGSGMTVLKHFDATISGSFPGTELIEGPGGTLFGTTQFGGNAGGGVVFKVNVDGSGFATLKNFDSSTGKNPRAGLLRGFDGALYGVALNGGAYGYGTIYKLNTDGSGFTVLKHFDSATTGSFPFGKLIQGANGVLYGTATEGGSNNHGTVFKLQPDGSGFSVLAHLENFTRGRNPLAALLLGSDGALYGTASQSDGSGTVFKLQTDGTGFIVLKFFVWEGRAPRGALIEGPDHALYGTTSEEGTGSYGTIFKLNMDGSGFTVLKNNFNGVSGSYPYSGLIWGADKALYGTLNGGGSNEAGTIFKINADGSAFTVLKSFRPSADISETGGAPKAELLQGSDGALYGTTSSGGSGNFGTIYKINRDGSGFVTLKHFDATTGRNPVGGLIQGSDGWLYGTTYGARGGGFGTVYKLQSDGSGFAVLKALDVSTGYFSSAGLLQGRDGALYGTTVSGGSSGVGTAFKLQPDGSGFVVLKHFDSASGQNPQVKLIQGVDGALYGTTANGGGIFGAGTIYKLNPDGSGFAVIKSFDSTASGRGLYGSLLQGKDGALYGTTSNGGTSNFGTVFKINPDGTGFAVLKNFDSTTGRYSNAGLIQRANGILYGTTYSGGSLDNGTVFQVNPDGTGFVLLKQFAAAASGRNPQAVLIEAADGFLYGTTFQGGSGAGVVFRLLVPPIAFPPEVRTLAATSVLPTGAVLNGTANPLDLNTDVAFEVATNAAMTGAVVTSSQNIGSGFAAVPVSFPLTGLVPNTTYYFRIAATSSAGTARGIVYSFLTPVIVWGGAGANAATGALDATIIPADTFTPVPNPVVYTNFAGQGYDIAATTYRLGAVGPATFPATVSGSPGWFFQGTAPNNSGYAAFTFRFFQTGTSNPVGVSGIRFRLEDAETGERFANFSYWDAIGNKITVPFTDSMFTYSSPPTYFNNGYGVINGAGYEGGTQTGKWIDIDLSLRSISGFELLSHRQTSSAGSVVMTSWGGGPLPMNVWRQAQFGGAWTNDSVSGDFADPNGDGVINLLAYAFGIPPLGPTVGGLPVVGMSGGYATITFTRPLSVTDLTYLVEVSGDMTTWLPGSSYSGTGDVPSNADTTQLSRIVAPLTETIVVRDNILIGPGSRYIRVRVTRP